MKYQPTLVLLFNYNLTVLCKNKEAKHLTEIIIIYSIYRACSNSMQCTILRPHVGALMITGGWGCLQRRWGFVGTNICEKPP